MSTGKPMYECTICGDPTPARGYCAPCAAQRRGAAAVAHQRIAEIRVACRVELPQHIEPVAPPPPTRPVERLTLAPLPKRPEKPASAPVERKAAPDMAREPRRVVAPLRLATVTAAPGPEPKGKSQREMVLDPCAPAGQCHILGCRRPTKGRGLCASCYSTARRGERTDLMLGPDVTRKPRGQVLEVRDRFVAFIAERPGVRIAEVEAHMGLSEFSAKKHMRVLVNAGRVVSHEGRLALLGVELDRTPVEERQQQILALIGDGWRSTAELAEATGLSLSTLRHALDRLTGAGVLRCVARARLAMWTKADNDSAPPVQLDAILLRIQALLAKKPLPLKSIAGRLGLPVNAVRMAAETTRGASLIERNRAGWRLRVQP